VLIVHQFRYSAVLIVHQFRYSAVFMLYIVNHFLHDAVYCVTWIVN